MARTGSIPLVPAGHLCWGVEVSGKKTLTVTVGKIDGQKGRRGFLESSTARQRVAHLFHGIAPLFHWGGKDGGVTGEGAALGLQRKHTKKAPSRENLFLWDTKRATEKERHTHTHLEVGRALDEGLREVAEGVSKRWTARGA